MYWGEKRNETAIEAEIFFKCQVYSKDPEEAYFTVDNLKVFINEKSA